MALSAFQEALKHKNFSHQELAALAKVHYTNIDRYERGEANPTADILNRIAQVLEVSPDWLMNGTLQDKAKETIEDEELLIQFRKIEKLPGEKKRIFMELLEAFIFKTIYKNNWLLK